MLDYKDIIIKHYALHMSGRQIAAALGASKSGVNDFLKAFEQCESLSYPLPCRDYQLWHSGTGLWQKS